MRDISPNTLIGFSCPSLLEIFIRAVSLQTEYIKRAEYQSDSKTGLSYDPSSSVVGNTRNHTHKRTHANTQTTAKQQHTHKLTPQTADMYSEKVFLVDDI